MTEHPYRVVASHPPRRSYPAYKYHTDPLDWSCTGTVKISCKDGIVDVTIFEQDSINVHHLIASGPARLTEEIDPVEE